MLSLLTQTTAAGPLTLRTHFLTLQTHLSPQLQDTGLSPLFADFTQEETEARRGQVTFVQIIPMGVSFMPPRSLNPRDSATCLFSQDSVKLTWSFLSLYLAISCTPGSPFPHTPIPRLRRDRSMVNNKPKTQLTMQKVLERSVQGQKGPLHNSTALKTSSCYTTQ